MAIDPRIKQELEHYLQNRVGRGDTKAVIMSAYKLGSDEIRTIQKAIPVLKDYNIENIVNENILGGFIIKFNTKIIDLSLRGQLKNFKKIMYEID